MKREKPSAMQDILTKEQFNFFVKQGYNQIPLIKACNSQGIDILCFFERLKSEKKTLLETQKTFQEERYSFIGIDPVKTLLVKKKQVFVDGEILQEEPLQALRGLLDSWRAPCLDDFFSCPFWGGALGFFSYEASRLFEKSSILVKDDSQFYDFVFYVYDQVIVFDHDLNKMYLCVSGSKLSSVQGSMNCLEKLVGNLTRSCHKKSTIESSTKKNLNSQSNFTKKSYLRVIEKVKDYIRKGHTYQVNLSQRFTIETKKPSFQVYKKLAKINPVCFAAYMQVGEYEIVCGSPERLVKVQKNKVSTRPIAGTRRRGDFIEDQRFEKELGTDSKEKAEHDMLVDLARNDLGRICRIGSVKVKTYANIIKYTHVMHIESEVVGVLQSEIHPIDVIAAIFPGGTITGVPKIRTQEIIAEVEPHPRGIYTGSIGYIGFNKAMDFNIVIRSILFSKGKAYVHVGGGITYDCNAHREYQETLNKAHSQFKSLE